MKPLISVIIPAYNAQKYIRQAVESVIQQTTDADIEVLVIDDGSTDSTKEIVYELQEECRNRKMDHREICYCPNEKNMGVAESRNNGIRKANGEYIAFWMQMTGGRMKRLKNSYRHLKHLRQYYVLQHVSW